MKLYSVVPRVLQTLAWAPTVLILRIFCHYQVKGREHLQGLKQAIFACNHAGELDPILLTAAALPAGFTPMFYVGAPDREFNDHFFGWRRHIYKSCFFRAWGSYPIRRGEHDYAKSLIAHEQILRDGFSICIFPEGGITEDGSLREGKGGVAYLLRATKVPIVPVYIAGTFKTPLSAILSRMRRISVSFGAPIGPEVIGSSTIGANEYKAVAQTVMQRIGILASTQKFIPQT
jgi:1-acyl-sn-glycerol-3-phosphate acyltransferase